jgi:hypothetical protein
MKNSNDTIGNRPRDLPVCASTTAPLRAPNKILKNIIYMLHYTSKYFPGVKRPGRGADHPPPSSAEVKKEYSYT